MARQALAKKDPRDIDIAGFRLVNCGVEVTGKPTFDEWQGAMQFVERATSACMWWYGDLLNYGEAGYGELASQYDGDGKYSYRTLKEAKHVSKAVPLSIRIDNLTWEHHHMVAALEPSKQKSWLGKAAKGEWPVSQMRKEMQDAKAIALLGENPLPRGQYHLIYADPPWRYEHCKADNRKIENQYPTMELDAICELEISKLAGPDCVLFLWATSPKLAEAMQVAEAWNFTYRTCMVWAKDKIGMGYYARQKHELLLVCTQGTPPVPAPGDRPPSVIESPREEHSKKPDVFYGLIESMYPKAKKVELFCRKPRKGWKAWGNEV